MLYGFDIQDDQSRDFLESLVADGQVPRPELQQASELAILRGKEEWDMVFACAGAVRSRTLGDDRPDPGLAPYLAYVLSRSTTRDANAGGREAERKRRGKRRVLGRAFSRFWEDEEAVARQPDGVLKRTRPASEKPSPSAAQTADQFDSTGIGPPGLLVPPTEQPPDDEPSSLLESVCEESPLGQAEEAASSSPSPRLPPLAHHHSPVLKRTRSLKSPFFTPPPTKKATRPPRGTVSSLPFPPLSAQRFGLIQESLSHDPFRLLVAVTFLIRTTGKAAIPVYHKVIHRFPTPDAFVRGDLEADLVPMIAHLGLPAVRCAAIGKYARIFAERPPVPGVKYLVRGYPGLGACQRGNVEEGRDGEEGEQGGVEDRGGVEDDGSRQDDGGQFSDAEAGALTPETRKLQKRRKTKPNSSEWEIGHLTQGRYAVDSGRIFCRDIFLGRSDHWMGVVSGEDRKPRDDAAFEPEWMRVLPEDKELRACLRWMWMREGYEWDPVTGWKSPLREEMRVAVEEGRVKYDEKGQLVILDGPLDDRGDG